MTLKTRIKKLGGLNHRKDLLLFFVDPSWDDDERRDRFEAAMVERKIPAEANVNYMESTDQAGESLYVPDMEKTLNQIAVFGRKIGDPQ